MEDYNKNLYKKGPLYSNLESTNCDAVWAISGEALNYQMNNMIGDLFEYDSDYYFILIRTPNDNNYRDLSERSIGDKDAKYDRLFDCLSIGNYIDILERETPDEFDELMQKTFGTDVYDKNKTEVTLLKFKFASETKEKNFSIVDGDNVQITFPLKEYKVVLKYAKGSDDHSVYKSHLSFNTKSKLTGKGKLVNKNQQSDAFFGFEKILYAFDFKFSVNALESVDGRIMELLNSDLLKKELNGIIVENEGKSKNYFNFSIPEKEDVQLGIILSYDSPKDKLNSLDYCFISKGKSIPKTFEWSWMESDDNTRGRFVLKGGPLLEKLQKKLINGNKIMKKIALRFPTNCSLSASEELHLIEDDVFEDIQIRLPLENEKLWVYRARKSTNNYNSKEDYPTKEICFKTEVELSLDSSGIIWVNTTVTIYPIIYHLERWNISGYTPRDENIAPYKIEGCIGYHVSIENGKELKINLLDKNKNPLEHNKVIDFSEFKKWSDQKHYSGLKKFVEALEKPYEEFGDLLQNQIVEAFSDIRLPAHGTFGYSDCRFSYHGDLIVNVTYHE